MKELSKSELQAILGIQPYKWGICKDASFQIWTHLKRLGHKPKLWSVSGHWWVEIDDWVIDTVLWEQIQRQHEYPQGKPEVIFKKSIHKKYVEWIYARRMR